MHRGVSGDHFEFSGSDQIQRPKRCVI